MKPTKAQKRAEAIREAVRHEFEMQSGARGFHTLTITFDNRAVTIPYQPWNPRESVTLPGRWEQDDEGPVQ